MSLSKTARKGICKHLLALIASNAIVMAASAQQWEFQEDFIDEINKGAETTADWGTDGFLELGLAQPLTTPAIERQPMGDTGGEDLRDSRGMALGDFDGDGDLDVVVGNEGGIGARNIIYRNVDGSFNFAPVTIGDALDLYQTLDIAVGDIDNDGDMDVVGGNFGDPAVYYLNDGGDTLDDATFASGTPFTVGQRTWAIGLADFDNDGDLDYVEANSGSSGQDGQVNSLYLNRLLENNELSFSSGISLSTSGEKARSRSLALGDIDNDGDIDLIFGEQPTPSGHPGYNTCHRWTGSGFSSPTSIQPTSTFLTFAVKLADVNGDGYLDLIEGNQGDPTHVYLNNMPNSGVACDFRAPVVVADSMALDTTVALEVADFNRDGYLDIVEGNNGDRDDDADQTNDVPQPVRLFLNNGDGTFANGLDELPPKQKIYGMDVGDVDGDGKLDLVSASSDEEQPSTDPLPVVGGNAVYYNLGEPGGTPVQQLYSVATSTDDVGSIGRNIPTGALRYVPFPPALHASLTYYLSNDNGNSWLRINPLRALNFPDVNTQLMWRVEMQSLTPLSTLLPEVDLLTISDNRPPRFSESGNDAANREEIQAAVGENFSVGMTSYFSDLEDHRMNFVGTDLPASFDLDPLSGELSGVPTTDDEANSPIAFQVEAFDGAESRIGYFSLVAAVGLGVPTITLNGEPTVTITVGDSFTDPGATASDFEDGDISADIVVGGDTVNTAVAGTYVITYNVTDSDGNAAPEVTRTVNVVAGGVPTITLNGAATINLNVGDSFTDPGATAADPEDGDLTASIVVAGDTVNTAAAGTYVITYNVADSDGNAAAEVTRTVIVSSATGGGAPTITLTGDATVTITVGDSFSDEGATASDPEDGDLTDSIVVGGDTVDTDTAGTYVITYDVTDSDGNAAPTVTRTVNVTVGGAPTITLNGSATVSITVGDSFTDEGATASDPEDGDLTDSIVVGGDTVNTSAAGTYVITYNVTDSDGNAADQVTRTVTVRAAPTPPPSGGGGGGGMTGVWELIGLMFAGLVGVRRRRAGRISV